MTRICDFPISETKRCSQPVADGRPNCGRHKTNLSTEQLGQNPTIHRKNGQLHVWAGEPDDFYCLIHGDPAYQVLCQLAGEKLTYCPRKTVEHKDEHGKLHRDDGPATIWPDGTQYWYQHGVPHRDDGPAITYADGARYWYRYGELHRDDGPAAIYASGTQYWYQHGELHRVDGPAIVGTDRTQQWYWRGNRITEKEHAKLREQSLGA